MRLPWKRIRILQRKNHQSTDPALIGHGGGAHLRDCSRRICCETTATVVGAIVSMVPKRSSLQANGSSQNRARLPNTELHLLLQTPWQIPGDQP